MSRESWACGRSGVAATSGRAEEQTRAPEAAALLLACACVGARVRRVKSTQSTQKAPGARGPLIKVALRSS